MFESWHSQPSVSSTSGFLVSEATSESRSDLLVKRMKLGSEKNLDGKEGQNAEAGAVNVTQPDPI